MPGWKWLAGLLFAAVFVVTGCQQQAFEQPVDSQAISSQVSEENDNNEPAADQEQSEPKEEKTEVSGADASKTDQPDQAEKKAPSNEKAADDPPEPKYSAKENSDEPVKKESKANNGDKSSNHSGKTNSPPKEEAKSSPPQPAEDKRVEEAQPQEPKKETEQVQILIQGDSKMGSILDAVNVEMKTGDTVYDILLKITKERQIQLETSGSGAALYVKGINNLYEYDRGDLSGWIFKINGKKVAKSAGSYVVNKGDRIEWLYSENLGKDV